MTITEDNPDVIRAARYFIRAIQANPSDPFTHLSYAKFLVLTKKYELAEDHFLEALVQDPNMEKGLLAYAEFLSRIRNSSMEAEIFRSRARKVRAFMVRQGDLSTPRSLATALGDSFLSAPLARSSGSSNKSSSESVEVVKKDNSKFLGVGGHRLSRRESKEKE